MGEGVEKLFVTPGKEVFNLAFSNSMRPGCVNSRLYALLNKFNIVKLSSLDLDCEGSHVNLI